MNTKEILDEVLAKEGGYVNRPDDPGGETNFGITWPTLRSAIEGHLVPPETTIANLTEPQARRIYESLYIIVPGFNHIMDKDLRAQLVDFGVNSGPARAIRFLQRLLQVEDTGVMDGTTLSALWKHDPFLLGEALAGARARFVDDLTDRSTKLKWAEEGLESRALSFIRSVPKEGA